MWKFETDFSAFLPSKACEKSRVSATGFLKYLEHKQYGLQAKLSSWLIQFSSESEHYWQEGLTEYKLQFHDLIIREILGKILQRDREKELKLTSSLSTCSLFNIRDA